MTRAIAIVGFARDTRELANAEPPEVEIWGLNLAHHFLHRWDRWFQIHPPDWKGTESGDGNYFGRDPDHLRFLQECGKPVYTREVDPRIPTSVAYPLAEVTSHLRRYFTSSVAYMIALAIHEGVDEIKLFGINLASHPEYMRERACVEYWLGVAEGMGITVTLPGQCPLLSGPLYAHDDDSGQKLSQERLSQWKGRALEARDGFIAAAGARSEAAPDRQKVLRAMLEERVAEFNGCLGGVKEAQFWLALTGGVDGHAVDLPPLRSYAEVRSLIGDNHEVPVPSVPGPVCGTEPGA